MTYVADNRKSKFQGLNALQLAAFRANIRILKILSNNSYFPTWLNSVCKTGNFRGYTPLLIAVSSFKDETEKDASNTAKFVEYLLELNADPTCCVQNSDAVVDGMNALQVTAAGWG